MISQTLGDRIRNRRKELKLTQKDLSQAIKGVSNVAVSQWESNTTKPNAENILDLSAVLQCDIAWLLRGEGKTEPISNVQFVQVKKSFYYPLFSTVKAGSFTEINLLNHIDGDSQFDMISSQINAGENAFFLLIDGDSMFPRFKEGDMVLIDPNIEPKPGKFVAAIDHEGKATFKQYKQLGSLDEYGRPHFNLVPLNDSHATISSLDHNIQLIGVAVEHRQAL